MEAELRNFILVWLSAIVFVSYCYYVSPKIKAGVFRFLSVLPVCALFLVLPLFFSSVHFSSSTAFYLSGFANLKLILFAFDQGPLLPLPPNLVHFICFTCFPIKLQQNPNSQNRFHKRAFAFRLFLFFLVLHVYKYSQTLPHYVLLGLCFVHLYLELEILLAPLKFLLSITLGCDLEPQFNEPYLATSLQDLWGRRWNLMVSAIFRSGVYNPVRGASRGLINSSWARFMGFFVTFLVSGLFHELVYFYITREAPKMGGHFVLCVKWGLHRDGGGREEDGVFSAAVTGETGGIMASHDGLCGCDRWFAVFPSVYKERHDGETRQ
ncbi:putative long-chain-alcohol O-fatty-acyltransferase 9 [Raphanus sativus]|nr:putative long-chain-alcohol O-fatty-acyltransferase 9 [Raphanus sativus]